MPLISSGGTPSYGRIMIFVDGGYLRQGLKEKFGNDRFSLEGFQGLRDYLIGLVSFGKIQGELIRTYYYDAVVDETEKEKRQEQNSFFSMLRHVPFCTVRLGRLIKTSEGYRQKGVDILMAIDMLSKAYENHYEIAILLAGDADFVNLVEAVKDAGKRIYGAYLEGHVSNDLLESFDVPISLTEDMLKMLVAK